MNRQVNRPKPNGVAKRPSSTSRGKLASHTNEEETVAPGDGLDLPLMDEVNQVIEKEKTLISLQLLEQQRMAQEWKQKYDNLIGQVVTDSSSGHHGDLRALEIVADSTTSSGSIVDHVHVTVDRGLLIHKIDESGITLNVSNVDLDAKAISEISKMLNEKDSSKASSSSQTRSQQTDVNILVMRNCGLEDKHTDALSFVLANTKIKGFDLSYNNLGTVFQSKLLDVLKNRKFAPQYIILTCNKPIAEGKISATGNISDISSGSITGIPERKTTTAKPVSKQALSLGNIVNCVTSSTWGIYVTLEDFDPLASIQQLQQQKSAKKDRDNDDLHKPASHLMLSYSFLKTINQVLDPLGETDEDEKFNAKVATMQQGTKSIVAVKRVKKPDPNSSRHGLALISVLGLVYAQLSKQTMKELIRTMHLSAATLTDLDLSFAYIGFYGAKLISSFLSKKECQLIRLGLAGNDIGSAGAFEICSALEGNTTLTYLDCSSNSITNNGLLAIIEPLSRNNILYQLCLNGGNNLSRDAIINAEKNLYYRGSDLRIKWSSTYQKLVPNHSLSLANYEETVYNVPQKKFVNMNRVGEATLYSIDLKFINPILSANEGRSLAFKWMWKMSLKPSALYNLSSYRHNLKSNVSSKLKNKSSSIGEDTKPHQSNSTIFYEVRILARSGDIYQSFQLPVPQTLLSSFDSMQQLEANSSDYSSWIDTSVPILLSSELPTKGTIEIRLLWRDSNAIDIIKDFRFETVRLTVFPIVNSSITVESTIEATPANSTNKEVVETKSVSISGELMGGDFPGWTDAVSDALCSSYAYRVVLQPYEHFIPGDFSVLRILQWHSNNHKAGFIKMDVKLKAVLNGIKMSNDSSFPSSSHAAESSIYTFGYEHVVLVISAACGIRRVVAEGSTETKMTEVSENMAEQQLNHAISDDQKHKQVLRLLRPWNWSELVVRVQDMETNDLIVVCGKATSISSTMSDADVSRRSVVSLRNCKLFCERNEIESPVKGGTISAAKQAKKIAPSADFVDGLMTSVFAVHNDPSLEFMC